MIQTSFNIFDLGVIIIVGLSALLSFYRGFLREIMSLGAWIAASVITLYTFPTVSAMIEPQVKSAPIASGLAAMGVFMIVLVLISVVSGMMMKYLKPSGEVGFLDNLIGLLFGVGRGVLLVAIAYFIMTLVIAKDDYPDWVKEAQTRPYVAKAADWVAELAPSYLELVSDSEKKSDKLGADTKKDSGKSITIHRGGESEKSEKKDSDSDAMPSFDELQRAIREENEAK